ncbi:uncharacterized protein LOC108213744 isoform X2 [Daucus carota subsp. sativus]|uniref:uncharacterized protein LOC108213744 isoform X2 n=1 Tax=Daucus carota subsp. sativus TaxID=79200 RepID=UPI003082EDB3
MAQLIRAQCRGKPLFNGEATLIGFEPKSKIRFVSTTTTKLLSSASSSVSSSPDDYKFREDVSNVDDSGFCNVGYDLFFDDPEFGRDELSCFRGLVLDISYRPVNVVCWKRAICLEFMDKVPHLLQVVKRRRIRSTLSRKNVLARDNFTCQYCSSSENLTIDHVVPTARGGEWTWENLVTACSRCNNRKGQKILEEANMKLKKIPKAPKDYDIIAIPLTNSAIQMLKMGKQTPEEWHEYLA